LTAVVAGLLVIGSFAVPIWAKYGGGTGEPNDPYLIYNANQMNTIGLNQGDWNKCFKLMADIDLGEYEDQEFNIIGTDPDNPFTGIFDGNDHRISNLNYFSTAIDYIGLFGYVSGENAEIKSLRLIDPNVDAGTGDYVGSLVGYLSSGTVINCSVQGGSVKGVNRVGGLAGSNSSGRITNCSATGNVAGDYDVGGLAGSNPSGTITNCWATTTTRGTHYIGGLVGRNYGAITYSYASGIVDGDYLVGGLVGSNGGSIVNCYAAGPVTGAEDTGGLTGSEWGAHNINSYWDIETSGRAISAGGEGKTTNPAVYFRGTWREQAPKHRWLSDIDVCSSTRRQYRRFGKPRRDGR